MRPRLQRSAGASVQRRCFRNSRHAALRLLWAALLIALVAAQVSLGKATAQHARFDRSTATSRQAGNWSADSTWSTTRFGTISFSSSGRTVAGSGTFFSSELRPGVVITDASDIVIGTVQSISSDTLLTLTAIPPIETHGSFVAWKARLAPAAGNDVIVQHAVALDSSRSAGSLTIKGASSSTGSLTLPGTQTLTVTGALALSNEGSIPGGAFVEVNGGSLNAGSLVTSTGNTRVASITLTSGTLDVAGNATIAAGGTSAAWCGLDLNSGRFHVGGNLTVGPGGTSGFARITSGSAGGSIAVAGSVAIVGPNGTIELGAAVLAAGGNLTMETPAGRTAGLSMSTGSARIAGNVSASAGGMRSIDFSDAGTLYVGGALGCGLTFRNYAAAPGSTVEFNGSGGGSLCGTGLQNVRINKSSRAAVTLTEGAAEVLGLLSVVSGTFSQTGSDLRALGGVDVSAGAKYRLIGSGTLSLGAGGMANAGTVQINGDPAACGRADSTHIESTVNGAQRPWSGRGVFDISDVTVRDQAGLASIDALSSTDLGNNGPNWAITGTCNPATLNTSTSVVSSGPNPSTSGVPVTFTATVSAGRNRVTIGSVTFIDGGACAAPETVLSGPTALSGNGQAAFTTSSLGASSHTITACYGGAAGHIASNGSVEQVVGRPNQEALVLNTTSPLTYRRTETMSVSGGSTGGTVIYILVSGPCTIAGSELKAESGTGECKVTAMMAGNDEFNEVASAERTVVLQKADQAAVVVTAPSEVTSGTAGTAAATGGSSSGDFVFFAGGSTGCSVLGTTVTVTNASGTCVLRAIRTGDSNYNDSAPSDPFVVTLHRADETPLRLTVPSSLAYGITGTAGAAAPAR
jgi:hypothetical protein